MEFYRLRWEIVGKRGKKLKRRVKRQLSNS